MTWLPDMRYPNPEDLIGQQQRRLQTGWPTLEGATDAQLEGEVQRRKERKEREIADAVKKLQALGYVVSGPEVKP